MMTYEVDGRAFDCRVIRIERRGAPTPPEVGDKIVADFGGDALARTSNGVYNDDVFTIVSMVAELEDAHYVLGVRR